MLRLRSPSKAAAAVAVAAASLAGVAYAYKDGAFSFHRQPAAPPAPPGPSPRNNELNRDALARALEERELVPCQGCLMHYQTHGDQLKADYPDQFPSEPRT
jgi:hypothetical protein